MSKKLWVGVDVSVGTISVCVLNESGKVVKEEKLPTSAVSLDQFLRPMRRSNIAAIGLEAGATAIHLARGLARLKYDVAVFEARQIGLYLGIRQNKTDRNDAKSIADVLRTGRGSVSEVMLKSAECQRIRAILTMRQQFVRMRVSGELGIGSLFRLYGGRLARNHSAKQLRITVQAEIDRLRKYEKIDLREEVEPMLAICERMRANVEAVDKKLARLAKEIDPCRRFMDIPGVGPLSALSFYSAIGDPHRFERNADVGAYLGLVPRVRQSGASMARLRISKMGNALTRSHLTHAAAAHFRAAPDDNPIKAWANGLRERRGYGRARAAVARKLAVTMIAMWKRGEPYQPDFSALARSPEDSQFP